MFKLLTQIQQTEDDAYQDYEHKNRLVICGNFAAWGEHPTTTTNLDVPLLRLMFTLATAPETTWSSIDTSSAWLNANIHEDDTILVTPPSNLGQNGHCQAQHSLACEERHLWIARGSMFAITFHCVPCNGTCAIYEPQEGPNGRHLLLNVLGPVV